MSAERLFWKVLDDCKRDVAAWPDFVKRAFGVPVTEPADAEIAAIRRRWHTNYDRGAHDYTDEGCRVLAEHAFRDVNYLLSVRENQDSK